MTEWNRRAKEQLVMTRLKRRELIGAIEVQGGEGSKMMIVDEHKAKKAETRGLILRHCQMLRRSVGCLWRFCRLAQHGGLENDE